MQLRNEKKARKIQACQGSNPEICYAGAALQPA